MNDHNRLEILSGIAQDIIDSCTIQRAKLLARKNKPVFFKTPFFKVAIAAVLCLAIGLPLLWMLLSSGKQVPIYQGMTLSSEPPAIAKVASFPYHPIALYDNPAPQFKRLAQTDDSLFYADQNENFYITVHIDNPDNFEIVSFTLNGKKYSSYMFEDGSDMENLILKCNVGDATGIIEYTIDAIKYIDGTTIKDVKLNGNRTVRVGVAMEDPIYYNSTVGNDFDSISVAVILSDRYNIQPSKRGRFFMRLYYGNITIEEINIPFGEPFVYTFNNLQVNTSYTLKIYGEFDSFDGRGMTMNLIDSIVVSTDNFASINVSDISLTGANYIVNWNDTLKDFDTGKIALYVGDQKIQDIVKSQGTFDNLLTDTTYTIKAECEIKGKSYTQEMQFTTQKAKVLLEQTDLIQKLHSVGGTFAITDTFNNGKITKIELYHKDKLLSTVEGKSTVLFENLDVPYTYQLKVTYTFDLKDGKGTQILSESFTAITQSEGLEIENGQINHHGTNTDSILYLNMPVGSSAFSNTQITKVICGEGVTRIESNAFMGCHFLTEIELPETLTLISSHAFYDCRLTSIELPDSLEYIGFNAFYTESPTFDSIVIPKGVTDISTQIVNEKVVVYTLATSKPAGWVEDWHKGKVIWGFEKIYTDEQGVQYAVSNNETHVIGYIGNRSTVVIPEGVVEIGYEAFSHCTILEKVVLPDSLITIQKTAFAYCEALSSINFPPNLTYIGDEAFIWTKLSKVEIPSGITEIRDNAFSSCYSLKTVVLPDGIKKIGKFAFTDCEQLKNINFPDGLTEIGYAAFRSCYELYKVILPNSLITIDEEAFAYINGMKYIYIPASVELIGANAFTNIPLVLTEAKSQPFGWVQNWAMQANVIWNVKEIQNNGQGIECALLNDGRQVLIDYYGTQTNFIIPSEIDELAPYAFNDCTQLRKVTVHQGITAIPNGAFYDCTSLTEVNLPNGLVSIGEFAFWGCCSLESIHLPDSIEQIKWRSFYSCNKLKTITIPKNTTEISKQVFSCCTELKSVVLHDGITEIGEGAFEWCHQLSQIKLPESLTSIRTGAFDDCWLLEIYIPINVVEIESNAFDSVLKIDVEADIRPKGWSSSWNGNCYQINWGVKQ